MRPGHAERQAAPSPRVPAPGLRRTEPPRGAAATMRALQRTAGNRAVAASLRGRAAGRPSAAVARVPVTENLVDESMRPVRAYGLVENAPQEALTQDASGQFPTIKIEHERSADEQRLISAPVNQALNAPGAFHAGHLFTRHLGGSFARHNLVPMTREYNAWGTYKQFENALDKLVREFPSGASQETLYNGRVFADIRVDYPAEADDGQIFEHLVAPDAVADVKATERPYYDYLRALFRRVPRMVVATAVKRWEGDRWVDHRPALAGLLAAASPRQGPRAFFVTRTGVPAARRRVAGEAGLPEPDPYRYKPPENTEERQRHKDFSFGQLGAWDAATPGGARVFNPLEDAGATDGAYRAGIAFAAQPRYGQPLVPLPPRPEFGQKLDPALRGHMETLFGRVSPLQLMEKHKYTFDELIAIVTHSVDPDFLDWLCPGVRDARRQRSELHRRVTSTPPESIATLLAAYEQRDRSDAMSD